MRTGPRYWGERLATTLLVVAAAAATLWSAKRALNGSKDFQWSPTRLILEGRDPFAAFSAGSGDILLAQAPNYLHSIYLILTPLGAMPFPAAKLTWIFVNIVIAIGIVIVVGRLALWTPWLTTVVGSVFLLSTPARIGFANGQHAMLLLALALITFAFSSRWWAGLPLAILMCKYSFSPLAVTVLLRRGWAAVALAAGITVAAAVIVWMLVDGRLLTVALGPFNTARTSVAPGVSDIMTVAESFTGADRSSPWLFLLGCAAAATLTVATYRRVAYVDWIESLVIGTLISLIAFKHLTHDYVLLLPLVVIALRMDGWRRIAILTVLTWQWFGLGAMSEVGISGNSTPIVVLSFISLLSALWVVVRQSAPMIDSENPPNSPSADADRAVVRAATFDDLDGKTSDSEDRID